LFLGYPIFHMVERNYASFKSKSVDMTLYFMK